MRAWEIGTPLKQIDELMILERCSWMPMRRNFCFERINNKAIKLSQEWMISRVEDNVERLRVESKVENET